MEKVVNVRKIVGPSGLASPTGWGAGELMVSVKYGACVGKTASCSFPLLVILLLSIDRSREQDLVSILYVCICKSISVADDLMNY